MTSTPLSGSAQEIGVTPQTSPSARVLEILDLLTPDGDFTVSEVSEKTLAWLEENEPALLAVWLRETGRQTIHEFLRGTQLRRRSKWARQAKSRDYRTAVEEAENGDSTRLSGFAQVFTISEDHIRRKVADMTAEDHNFVARQYEDTASRVQMKAAFHRAIARRLGPGETTKDVMDEEQYDELFASITGSVSRTD